MTVGRGIGAIPSHFLPFSAVRNTQRPQASALPCARATVSWARGWFSCRLISRHPTSPHPGLRLVNLTRRPGERQDPRLSRFNVTVGRGIGAIPSHFLPFSAVRNTQRPQASALPCARATVSWARGWFSCRLISRHPTSPHPGLRLVNLTRRPGERQDPRLSRFNVTVGRAIGVIPSHLSPVTTVRNTQRPQVSALPFARATDLRAGRPRQRRAAIAGAHIRNRRAGC